MKKIILLSLVIVFVFCSFSIPSTGQDGEVGTNIILGLIEDELIQESAQELEQIAKELAKAAKESGDTKSILPFTNALLRNAKAIVRNSKRLSVEKCGKRVFGNEEGILKLLSRTDKLQGKLCSNVTPTVSRDFHPMFVCVIGSPCVCMHYPNRPECQGTGGGMTKCLSDEDFALSLERTENLFNDLASALGNDSDSNGLPDYCQNN